MITAKTEKGPHKCHSPELRRGGRCIIQRLLVN